MASNMSPEMKAKFETLKMEVRAIILSANDGITPANLDRDYSDINGCNIPYRRFGFNTLFEILDEMQDTVYAYQRSDGAVLLFAKSSEQTRHLESLISRQRKMPRIGRFGGIIQKPAEECHGTPERRQLITERIIRLTLNQQPMWIKYNDLFTLYEAKYGEALDPRDDFYCNAKSLFDVKLSNYFEVRDAGHGVIYVRLKDEVREKLLKGPEAAAGRPTIPTVNASRPTQEQIAVPVVEHQIAVERDAHNAAAGYRQEIPISPEPMVSPVKEGLDLIYVNKNKRLEEITKKQEDEVSITVRSEEFKKTEAPPKPLPVVTPSNTSSTSTATPASERDPGSRIAVASDRKPATARPLFPVVGLTRKLSLVTNVMNISGGNTVTPIADPPVTRFKTNLRRLLDAYSNGIEIVILEWAYHTVFGEQPLENGTKKGNAETLMSILRNCDNICEIIEKDGAPYLVKARTTPVPYAAPKILPPVNISWHADAQRKEIADQLTSKLRPDADRSGTAVRLEEEGSLKRGIEQLKMECKQEIHGKELNVADCGFLSVAEMAEAMPGLFVLDKTRDGVILRDTQEEVLENSYTSSEMSTPDQDKRPVVNENTDKADANDRLMRGLWTVIMAQPTKSIYLDEIPAAYQKETGHPFPIKDIDQLGLMVCDYIDRFYCKYSGGKLQIIAEPEWAC